MAQTPDNLNQTADDEVPAGALLAAAAEGQDVQTASQWRLMWWKFRKNKLAMVSLALMSVLYLVVIFCEFLAPSHPEHLDVDNAYAPPQRLHWFSDEGFHLRPFVYGVKNVRHPVTRRRMYVEDRSKRYPIRLFAHGDSYKLWGLFDTDRHLLGVDQPGTMYLMGTDSLGRDLLSRVCYGARVSMTIGLVGVSMTFVLGLIIGTASGYFGGWLDHFIQRSIEILRSFPRLPLWLALSAALPVDWSPIKVYFGITVVLSLVGWPGLARVVRGKILSLREEDFATAAMLCGASNRRIMFRHLLPSFTSHIIVRLTLTLPGMILGETSLSFLGLGLRKPVISWGVLLKDAQNVQAVARQPWLLTPALAVVVVVLAFNFIGDGLRDAADPYAR